MVYTFSVLIAFRKYSILQSDFFIVIIAHNYMITSVPAVQYNDSIEEGCWTCAEKLWV